MRYLVVFVLALMTSFPVLSQNKFSFSNKTEVRYGNAFVSDKVLIQNGRLTRNSLSLGAVANVTERIKYKTFYTLQNSLKSQWIPEYILGFSFEYKFR